MVEATSKDPTKPIGKISHIYAHADKGPRAKPDMTSKERDCYNNWILLCGTHHDTIDVQPNTYTPEQLKQWKVDHEKWVTNKLAIDIPSIGFLELEMTTSAILSTSIPQSIDLTLIPLQEKIQKNSLSQKSHERIMLGLVKSKEVEEFIGEMAKLKSDFPDKLKAGFVSAYVKLKNEDKLIGDSLFFALHDFASSNNTDFDKQAAGLAVLVYLFEKCEVFER